MSAIPARALMTAFARSFLIQGSWNYRTMIGSGFGFSILPVLRWIHRGDPEGLVKATGRHTEHFNAHPYLAGLAIGAAARLECDRADPEAVRRFKQAARGPLGGLGDRLFWAGWLPATVLMAVGLSLLGVTPWVVLVAFLLLYNVAHLTVRAWAFGTGVEAGAAVARRIQAAHLSELADQAQGVATVTLGLVAGLLAARGIGAGPGGWIWVAACAVALAVGARFGPRIWRPMAAGLIVTILVLAVAGILG